MRTCTTCGISKDDDDFSWKNKAKSRRQAVCRICSNEYKVDWYQRNKKRHMESVKKNTIRYNQEIRELIKQYLSTHPCVDCGETDIVVLEFDHRNDKKSLVSRRFSVQSVLKEISKCDIRCCNCHRRKTAKQLGWWRAAHL